nr:clp protease proteolytic subunit [Echinodorus paniculatus]
MPIGVPRVPFRIPGEEDASWVDINRLYRERLLFLGEEIECEIANQLMALMVYLGIEDSTKEQYLFINTPGGWVLPGLAIYDAMHWIQPEVNTVCMGLAASMGSLILVGGVITKRLAYPHARVMIHQPSTSYFEGSASDLLLEAEELLNLRRVVTTIYAERTTKPFWALSEDMERDVFMSATEAQVYGLVDLVGL